MHHVPLGVYIYDVCILMFVCMMFVCMMFDVGKSTWFDVHPHAG